MLKDNPINSELIKQIKLKLETNKLMKEVKRPYIDIISNSKQTEKSLLKQLQFCHDENRRLATQNLFWTFIIGLIILVWIIKQFYSPFNKSNPKRTI